MDTNRYHLLNSALKGRESPREMRTAIEDALIAGPKEPIKTLLISLYHVSLQQKMIMEAIEGMEQKLASALRSAADTHNTFRSGDY